MANAIQLHQTLHGYRDGHQLLSSSLSLTRDQQWQLLVMSDLSGPSFRTGFDSYLTGYPLEQGGLYCLARTWFAPELSRPGCVWTHTLLISDTDVAQISDFQSLLSLFHHPLTNEDTDFYNTPIDVTLDVSSNRPHTLTRDISSELLSVLYGSPTHKVILVSESSRQYEGVVIAVFSQQWPRLRRNFKFCTGALAIRDLKFDLAVTPPNVLRQPPDDEKIIALTPSETGASEQAREDWVRIAMDDLSKAVPQPPLRRFLWKFGPDYAEGRGVFRPLCEIHLASLRSSESVDQVLSAMSHFFPEEDSSQRLKADFFGVGGRLSQLPRNGESSVVRALVTHPGASAVSAHIAAVKRRAESLVKNDGESAINIAIAALSIGGTRSEQYLDGFAAGVESGSTSFHDLPTSLTFDLLKRRPSLLMSAAVWKGPIEHQLALASQVSSFTTLGQDYGGKITNAVLQARAWASLTSIVTQFGYESVTEILTWIDALEQLPISVPQPVLDALGSQRNVVTEVIRKKQIGPRSLRVASALLDPRSFQVQTLGTSVWVGLTENGMHLAFPEAELRSRVFMLSIGLALCGDGDVRLIREGFSAVYNAAYNNRLDDNVWSFVEPYLPWYVVTWDRCIRLTRGVVRLFLDRDWPHSEFLLTFATPEQFSRALEETDRTRRGRWYVNQMCRFINSSFVDEVHADILRRHCPSFVDEKGD
jgi:hypothetical protein